MQLHQNPSLKGTLVKNKTGSPSGSPEIAVLRTNAKPLWAPRQSGDRADLISQELDMASISTTTPLTELQTIDDKMIDWSQMEASAYPNGFESLIENSIHEDPPTGTLNTAIFDVQLDLLMGMDEELLLPSSAGPLSEPPGMTGMMNSVLPSERPISPSEFLHKPAPSYQHQLPDLEFSPEVDKMIEELLPHTSANVNWDSSQLDLDLFNHPDESDMLGSLVQECGILEEAEEKTDFNFEESGHAITQQAVAASQPSRLQRDFVGPVRVRRERRASKKPARYRDSVFLEEDKGTLTTTKALVRVEPEDVVASISDNTPSRRGNYSKELSNEEKYFRSRIQNNLASKRCREKRRANLEKMVGELKTLEERNKVLNDKVAKLTTLRDEFQKFVNNFLVQRMIKKD